MVHVKCSYLTGLITHKLITNTFLQDFYTFFMEKLCINTCRFNNLVNSTMFQGRQKDIRQRRVT